MARDKTITLPENADEVFQPWRPENPIDTISDRVFDGILRMAGLGLTYKQIASWAGIPEMTFHDMRKRSPEFSRVIENARTNSISKVAGKCFELAMNGDMAAIKLFLQHVGKWQSNTEVNNTINMQVNNLLEQVPIDDIAKLLRAKKVDDGASSAE